LPNRPRLKFTVAQTDLVARGAVVLDHVVSVGEHAARGRIDDAAGDADQRGLARAIGAQQREDLALLDGQTYILQGLEPAGVGLRKTLYGNDRLQSLSP
jgi:hypothetical protein